MNQRIGMQHFNGARQRRRTFTRRGGKPRKLKHQRGAQPLAGVQQAVTHRIDNRRLEPHARITQAVAQRIISLPRIRGELLVKPHRYPPLPLKAFLSSIVPLQFFHWKNQPA